MIQVKDNTDLREYFKKLTGKDNKFILPAPKKFISRDEMSEYLSRAEEAARLFGMTPKGPLKNPNTELILVTSEEMADAVYNEVYEKGICAFDLETTGFNHYFDHVVSMQISTEVGRSYYFPFAHKNFDGNLDFKRSAAIMGKILADPTILKVGHNLKFDYKWFCVLGYKEIINVHDTMIMSHLLNENRMCGHGLKELVEELLQTKMIHFSELNIWDPKKKFKEGMLKDFSELNIIKAMPYACPDSDYTLRLQTLFWPQIEKSTFKHLFTYVEQPLMFTIARMELAGIKVDEAYFRGLHKPFQDDIAKMTSELERLAEEAGFKNETDKKGNREPFNPNSNPQVVKLTEMLGLSTGKFGKPNKKTGKARMSVDKKGRAKLKDKHPAYALMDSLSEKNKTLGTYLIPLVDRHMNKVTGRIHTSFHQHITVTGRLSSSEPNLQNIPKKYGPVVRQGFIPEPGYLFIRADYSQIELKIVAHMSRCQPLIDAFIRGDDIHATTAIKAFKLDEEFPGITPKHVKDGVSTGLTRSPKWAGIPVTDIKKARDKAKAVSFGILYGTTSWGLSKNLNCTPEEAQKLIDDFYTAFPELRLWINKTVKFMYGNGYVETLMKRRRRFVKDENGQYKFGSDREAQNAPVQGTSADITKWAMIGVEELLESYDARLVLQVHDELIVECKKDQVSVVAPAMVAKMEEGLAFFGLSMLVPTTVEHIIQDAWGNTVTKCKACESWAVKKNTKNVPECTDCKAQN